MCNDCALSARCRAGGLGGSGCENASKAWVLCIEERMNGIKGVLIYILNVEFLSLSEMMNCVVLSPPL